MITELTFKNGTTIKWSLEDDGGGSAHYIDFLSAIPTDKKYARCLEWCAGCSAISFSLLDAKIVDEIILMDIYKPALDRAMENAKVNNLNVKYYNYDAVGKIPINEKFDLVVANPPHCPDDFWMDKCEGWEHRHRITCDLDWKIHTEFYANITKYLNNFASIYISQTCEYEQLTKLAKKAGLVLVETLPAKTLSIDTKTNAIIKHYKYEEKIY